ncbi:MAG: hypothetical protein P8H62_13160 [Henriciella sp.]|nr:hypothetical protein [Henriciella sp.]
MLLAIDLDEDLIQVPAPLRTLPHRLRSSLADRRGKDRSKSVPPVSHALMAHIDTAFMEQVFDISQRKWKSNT